MSHKKRTHDAAASAPPQPPPQAEMPCMDSSVDLEGRIKLIRSLDFFEIEFIFRSLKKPYTKVFPPTVGDTIILYQETTKDQIGTILHYRNACERLMHVINSTPAHFKYVKHYIQILDSYFMTEKDPMQSLIALVGLYIGTVVTTSLTNLSHEQINKLIVLGNQNPSPKSKQLNMLLCTKLYIRFSNEGGKKPRKWVEAFNKEIESTRQTITDSDGNEVVVMLQPNSYKDDKSIQGIVQLVMY